MAGRSLKASKDGIEKAKKALSRNSLNQKALAQELGLARSTVTNFFRCIPIDRLNFEEICQRLGLEWQEIIDPSVFSAPPLDPYTQSWRCVHTLTQHRSTVISVAISPNGETLASGSGVNDQTIKIWNVNTGKLLRSLPGHSSGIMLVAFCPDGTTLVSVSSDKTIKIWNICTGRLLSTFSHTEDSSWFWSVATSPDGKTLASGNSGGKIKLWNLHTGEVSCPIINEERYSEDFVLEETIFSVAISPDNQFISGGTCDGKIKGWYLDDGELFCIINNAHPGAVNTLAFSPDGNLVASSDDEEGLIKVWRLITDELLYTLTGHSSSVNAVAFSPDGQTIASAGSDKTIKLWNLNTGELNQTLDDHTGSVLSVTFSPDSQALVSGSVDNTIKIWRCD